MASSQFQFVNCEPNMNTVQPIIALQPNLPSRERHGKVLKPIGITGILNVILGSLIFISGVVLLANQKSSLNYILEYCSPGVCMAVGTLIFFTGIIGILAWRIKKHAVVAVNIGLNVFCSIGSACDIILSSASLIYYGILGWEKRYFCPDGNYYTGEYYTGCYRTYTSLRLFFVVYSILIGLSVIELIISIVAASFSCGAACKCCCCYPKQTRQVMVYNPNGQICAIPVAASDQAYTPLGLSNPIQSDDSQTAVPFGDSGDMDAPPAYVEKAGLGN